MKKILMVLALLPIVALADFATGSGCAISDKYVLTAYHVVDDADKIIVSFGKSVAIKATVYKKNIVEDWAVLKLEKAVTSYVSCSDTEVSLGQRIYTLGFPSSSLLGEDVKYADGVVSALSGIQGNENAFQFSVPIQPGNSGGPLFDELGRLVGIVQSTINPELFYKLTGGALPQNVNFGFPISKLKAKVTECFSTSTNAVSLSRNQLATCLIKVTLRPSRNVSQGEMKKKADVSTQKERKFDVSRRFSQLANYLDDVANGVFELPDGSLADVCGDDGFNSLDLALRLTYESMCMEVERNVTENSFATRQDIRDGYKYHAKHWMNKARRAMAQKYNKSRVKQIKDISFFGLKMGDKIESGETVYIKGEIGYRLRCLINGSINDCFQIIPQEQSSSRGSKEVPYLIGSLRECKYRKYDVWLSTAVLGMRVLHVYTDVTGRIFCIHHETEIGSRSRECAMVSSDMLIAAYEKKLGLKFEMVDENWDNSLYMSLLAMGHEILPLSRIFQLHDVQVIQAGDWRVNVAFPIGSPWGNCSLLIIVQKDFYRNLQMLEEEERTKRIRAQQESKSLDIRGL